MTVLAVVTRDADALPLARLGLRLAQATRRKLVVLRVSQGEQDGEAVTEGALDGDGQRLEADAADAACTLRRVVTRSRLAAVLAEAGRTGATWLIAAKPEAKGEDLLPRRLFTAAGACHLLLLATGASDGRRCERVLCLAGPTESDVLALELGHRLAGDQGRLHALWIEPDTDDLSADLGRRGLERALGRAGLAHSGRVERDVRLAGQAAAPIAADLLLRGASDPGALRGQLFGVPPELLDRDHGPAVVGVVRRRFPVVERLQRALGRVLALTVPQLSREERVELYDRVRSGSRWQFDFMLLICLSTTIAGLGLLQDSAAVVIGAMLVAPLMTPILGAGLALMTGNLPLLRDAARAIGGGFLLALLIGVGLGWLAGPDQLTAQLAARVDPSHLDLGVGFCAGFAAAYCLGRAGLLAALPGVAIAAALVPPIATTGICLAIGRPWAALGASLLFTANVVMIVLGAAVSLYGGGLRGKTGTRNRVWARVVLATLVLAAVGLAQPLGREAARRDPVLPGGLEVDLNTVPVELRRALTAIDASLEPLALSERGPLLELRLQSRAPLESAIVQQVVAAVRARTGHAGPVRVTTELAVTLTPGARR